MKMPYAVYKGGKPENGFIDAIAQNGFFAVVELEETEGETPSDLLHKLFAQVTSQSTTTLAQLETQVLSWIREHNLPMSMSFACMYLVGHKALVKTTGGGEIYIKRGREFAKLIRGDHGASGIIEYNDYLIVTTTRLSSHFEEKLKLEKLKFDRDPLALVEEITPHVKSTTDIGAIAVFIKIEEGEDIVPKSEEQALEEKVPTMPTQQPLYATPSAHTPPRRALSLPASFGLVTKPISSLYSKLHERSQLYGRKKTLTFILVFVLFLIFLWSVLLSSQRRTDAQKRQKIQHAKEVITGQLAQAEDVAFLNLPRAQALLLEAKSELADLKKELKDGNYREVDELEKLIQSKERSILKKESKKEEEFFDLSLEKKDARGDKLYLTKDNLAILDKRGSIYILSLSQKSLDAKNNTQIAGASLAVFNDGTTYFYKKGTGIVQIDQDDKTKKVISNDKEWGSIVDMNVFNGNIYLLDTTKNQVFKYVPAEDGFSEKSSYVKSGQGANLNEANSLAIDSSVYVGLTDRIIKYVSGVEDTFATKLPETSSKITKIFTNEDTEKVYAWDKGRGAIYILNKSGEYEREVNAQILKQAADLVVYKNQAYILSGQKIYTINLD